MIELANVLLCWKRASKGYDAWAPGIRECLGPGAEARNFLSRALFRWNALLRTKTPITLLYSLSIFFEIRSLSYSLSCARYIYKGSIFYDEKPIILIQHVFKSPRRCNESLRKLKFNYGPSEGLDPRAPPRLTHPLDVTGSQYLSFVVYCFKLFKFGH